MSLAFSGYAALFDVADRGGDVIRRGAFAGAGRVPLLWQHRGAPVGRIEVISEDEVGLRVAGVVEHPVLERVMRAGAVSGLSIGFRAVGTGPPPAPPAGGRGARRELRRVALAEVSLVARPMQPGARVDLQT